jgi:Zn-dependent protease with chaperone function
MSQSVIWGILFFSVLITITLYLAYRTAGGLIRKCHTRFGFDDISDIASLPLILLLISLFSLVITPIAFSFTRYQEHEADRFGLEITQDNHSAATAFVKLQEENLSNPRPGILSKLWRSSHPTRDESTAMNITPGKKVNR